MVYCFQLKGVLEILKAGRSTLAPILNTCQRHEHLLIIPPKNMHDSLMHTASVVRTHTFDNNDTSKRQLI